MTVTAHLTFSPCSIITSNSVARFSAVSVLESAPRLISSIPSSSLTKLTRKPKLLELIRVLDGTESDPIHLRPYNVLISPALDASRNAGENAPSTGPLPASSTPSIHSPATRGHSRSFPLLELSPGEMGSTEW